METKRKGLSLTALAAIALVLLALGMLGNVVVQPTHDGYLDASLGKLTVGMLLETVSWAAAPIVCWLLVVLIKRGVLFIGVGILAIAVVSEVPHDVLTHQTLWTAESQNPAWALLISWIVIQAFQRLPQSQLRILLAVAVVIAALIWIFGFSLGTRLGVIPLGFGYLAFTLVFYTLWGSENRMMFSAGGVGAAMFITPALGVVVLHYRRSLTETLDPLPQLGLAVAYPVLLAVAAALSAVI
ncbi:ABC transporter [Corynebacterium diphtheriae]|uniref:ABC transporter n=1 Tax=Corynebacterium diphtheriae TaxID=1717 RepID=UPI00217CDA4B|nr:ABC transporter [Corynebacterium diphtheriae]